MSTQQNTFIIDDGHSQYPENSNIVPTNAVVVPYVAQMSSHPGAIPLFPVPHYPQLMSQARLSKEQHRFLEEEFMKNNKPTTAYKKELAMGMHVSVEKINNWFQNRRAKKRQQDKKGPELSIHEIHELHEIPFIPPVTVAIPVSVTTGAVQPLEQNVYGESAPQQWQTQYEGLHIPRIEGAMPAPPMSGIPQQSLSISQESNGIMPIEQDSLPVGEDLSNTFEISSDSDNSPNYTDMTDSEMSRQSNEPPSMNIDESGDTKSAIDVLEQSERRSSGMSRTKRKPPPTRLLLGSSNRSASYSAAPASPGTPDIRRTHSAIGFPHRVQKSRCSSGQRSPIRHPMTAHQMMYSQPQFGSTLFPQTPLSPYIMSSTAEHFPEVPNSAASEFGKNGWPTSQLNMTGPIDINTSMSSPPITPHSGALASLNGSTGEFWSPPQSAPATRTHFSTAIGSNSLLAPMLTSVSEHNSERRGSLPAHNLMVSNEGFLTLNASNMVDLPIMTTSTTLQEMSQAVTDTVNEQLSAPSNGFMHNFEQMSNDNLMNPIPVSNGHILNVMSSESLGFSAGITPASGLVNHLEAMASAMPADNNMMGPMFTNINPFQQSPNAMGSNIAVDTPVASNYPSPTSQTSSTTASSTNFVHFKPNADAGMSSMQTPKIPNAAPGLQWNHTTSDSFNNIAKR